MAEYAILDENGEVVNIIVADQKFVDNIVAQIDDSQVDTGDLQITVPPVLISELEEKPGVGWKLNNDSWERPVEPEVIIPPSLVETVLEDPALAGLTKAQKASVQKAIEDARERGLV